MKKPSELRLALLTISLSLARANDLDLNELLPGYGSSDDASSPNPKKKLNTREAAEVLSCSPKTLQNWRSAGTGPKSSKIGGRHVYDVVDLSAFQRKRTESPAATHMPSKKNKRRRS